MLGEIGDLRAIEPLIARLEDGHSSVHTAAAAALTKNHVAAVEPLIATVRQVDASARESAIELLGEIADDDWNAQN